MVSFKFLAPLVASGCCVAHAAADVVTVNQTFVNTTGTVQIFTFTKMLFGAEAGGGDSVMGGSVAATLTDLNGNGATLTSVGDNAVYTALIGATAVQQLYTGGFVFSVGQFLSQSTIPDGFGNPIPSLPVPEGVMPGSPGISLVFALTPGDAVTFAATFVVQPIPGPGALPLLAAMGLIGSRRRRS